LREQTLAYAGLARHGLIEAGLGGLVALAALTAAHASLPHLAQVRQPPPAHADILPKPTVTPAPPPVLIAFRSPLPDGEVGSPFGLRRLPWEDKARLHAGVDMEAPSPEPVLAAADGVVSRMGEDPGYGRFVELTHAEGLTTLYGHLARFADGVAPGAALKAGAPVGRLGSSGTSTGLHLHFEIRDRRDRPLNPELLLGRSFARAGDLPLAAARRIPRRVREAYVSRIPRSKLALMQARSDAADPDRSGDEAPRVDAAVSPGPHHRIHVRLNL
jgi:murein DD-endopeptidase MepM/ murein hydrolase activator NlpD